MKIFRSAREREGLDLEICWEENLSRRLEGLYEEDPTVGQTVCQSRKNTKDFHLYVPPLTADFLEASTSYSALLCALQAVPV